MISWCLNNDLRGSGRRSFKTVARCNTGHNDTTNEKKLEDITLG